jgi:hypothetical protein
MSINKLSKTLLGRVGLANFRKIFSPMYPTLDMKTINTEVWNTLIQEGNSSVDLRKTQIVNGRQIERRFLAGVLSAYFH